METLAANDLKGVGGWLTFRVLQLIVFVPIVALTDFIKLPLSIWLIASSLIALIGFTCGITILLERPIALTLTGLHLGLLTADWLCLASWTLLRGSTHKTAMIMKATSSITVCLLWFLYFRRSLRVRNTFGRNL